VIDVEREPDGDAPPRSVREGARDETGGRLFEVEVVEGKLEGRSRAGDELARVLGDLEGALTPVGQGPNLDRQA
jgi:hypothetical protein